MALRVDLGGGIVARITFKNMQEYELRLSRLGKKTKEIAGIAIYEAADIVANEIRRGIEALPVVSGYGTPEKPLPGGVTKAQKEGLLDGLGIAKMQDDGGFLNVKIGFDGYNATTTDRYPKGQPNQLVARGAESGTTWKKKSPFVRPAVNRAKPAAEQKMQQVIDQEINTVMK